MPTARHQVTETLDMHSFILPPTATPKRKQYYLHVPEDKTAQLGNSLKVAQWAGGAGPNCEPTSLCGEEVSLGVQRTWSLVLTCRETSDDLLPSLCHGFPKHGMKGLG